MREPDLIKHYTQHPDWKAWKTGTSRTTLASWLIEAPGVAIWSHYLLGLVHLRDVEGVDLAKKVYDKAGFEILLAALDPNQNIDPDGPPWKTLSPVTLTMQFGGVSDDTAIDILGMFAREVVEGRLSPEPGGADLPGLSRENWRQNLAATLACISEGRHLD